MDIKKELSSNQTILLLMPSLEYNNLVVDIAKQLSSGSVCYVTLNKTYISIKENLEKRKVTTKNIIFIDAISKTIKKTPKQTDTCYFVSSPGSLTELSLSISKFLKHNFEYLIFDSLSSLLVYQSKAPISRFVSSIVNKIKEGKTKAVFYALGEKNQSPFIKETSMFVDKVVDLSKKSGK